MTQDRMYLSLEVRLGWLAGILDGEGSIVLRIQKGRVGVTGKVYGPMTMPVVSVENTDDAMLNEIMAICDLMGVRYHYHACRTRASRPNSKSTAKVMWQMGPNCRAILELLLPYLVTKRARAELMLRALTHRAKAKGPSGWTKPKDDAAFVQMVEEMKLLNQKGRGDQNAC